jgi:DNA transformation protein and related proteins
MDSRSIAELPGLGPRSQQMLAQAGIQTVDTLRALGAIAACVRTRRRVHRKPSLNLLWGLEAALRGLHGKEVAREHRTSLLLALEDHEREHPELPRPLKRRECIRAGSGPTPGTDANDKTF